MNKITIQTNKRALWKIFKRFWYDFYRSHFEFSFSVEDSMCICHFLSNKGQWLDITLMYGWIKVPPWQTEFKFTCWEVHHFLIKNIKCVNRHYISNLHNNPSLADFRDIEIHSFCSNSYTATSGFQLLHKVHSIEFWLIFSKSVRIEKRFCTVLPFQGIQQLNHLLICFQTYFVWIYQNSHCCRNLVISTSFGSVN